MNIAGSKRLKRLGSAIFAEIAEWKEQVRSQGMDIIDLGIGSPDQPPSPTVMKALINAVSNPQNYGYPSSEGSLLFRQTVARWYKHRFDVELNPDNEILALMGSQDGLAHLAMAITDPGDLALVPDPGYPIYSASLILAGVTAYTMPLRAENEYLPNLKDIPVEIAQQAKFMLLNYPSNPLSAVADRAFFEQLVEFAVKNEIIIVHDLAYSEMTFDGFSPLSILQIAGAKEIAVEFHSLSKSFNMAGCRLAFMVGNASVVKALRTLKSNIDYGVFLAVQEAGIAALEEDMTHEYTVAKQYERRRDLVIEGLKQAGWDIPLPKATMFIWAPIPQGWTSRQISREILLATGVVVIPGDAFGLEGEGYVRIALVQNEERLAEAVSRIGRFLHKI
ncbi:aminotransferase class I/II-fold pyridoxal phosphate-dependent enzyme [Paenibacillus psychroresistens]|uniref:Aminotransferase n=1 Tax=Paenibacillus psychroresistens TaxID=1778678 RepID=A0A6B8RFV0_9BACL|nr:aminotransferase class I/II-fold pyridoxal phosphate-dependent enzyme [Paenibacillus psychroresistens]QGQ94989.1 aminotransferase class I/II-fold pyridoxal phosphate-dependent enzyme [Paenibacillus psychroresistens]